MNRLFLFTKRRCHIFLLATGLPLICFLFGLLRLAGAACFNTSFCITFILIPLITTGLLGLSIFCGRKQLPRQVMAIVFATLFVPAFLISLVYGQFDKIWRYSGQEAGQRYTEAEFLNELMPALTDIGEPLDMEYIHFRYNAFIFLGDTDYLICRYTPEEYQAQKAQLEKTYRFREDNITLHEYEFAPRAVLDGYQFRMADEIEASSPPFWYPKYMVLVGCSDETNQIIYLSYFDTDLDYITSIPDFLHTECGWNYIRSSR